MVYYVETTYDNVYMYGKHVFIISKKKDGRNVYTIANNKSDPITPDDGYESVEDHKLIRAILSKDKW